MQSFMLDILMELGEFRRAANICNHTNIRGIWYIICKPELQKTAMKEQKICLRKNYKMVSDV